MKGDTIMKKPIKKLTYFLCLFTLIALLLPINSSAATPRLNKTSKTLKVGESYTLKLIGAKKTVKWVSSNKAIATVSKNGKVTAKSTGSATIAAKMAKKTYKCKLTVKKAISMENIQYTTEECDGTLIMKIINNNDYTVYLDSTAVFFDSNGSPISSDSEESGSIIPGGFNTLCFEEPYDDENEVTTYSTFKIKSKVYGVSSNAYKSYTDKIDVSDVTLSPEKIVVKAQNNSNSPITLCKICIFMYDANGKLIRYREEYLDDMGSGETAYTSFEYPGKWDDENDNYHSIKPTSYKIYVLTAANID